MKREIAKGQMPVCAGIFSNALEDEVLDEFWTSRIRSARQSWEHIFSKIECAGVKIPPRALRRDESIWHEMRILSRLVDKFIATYEPGNIDWMKGKKPEFLLESPDGNLVLEVVSVGFKPDEIREGTRGVAGVNAKNSLMGKWRKKFNECNMVAKLPIVIAVQTRWRDDFNYDMVGSLYGPEQIIMKFDPSTGKAVGHRAARGHEMGFFSLPCVGCISAVAGIKQNDTPGGDLQGELFRPLRQPCNPLPHRLWVRLRDALFGETHQNLVSEMMRIPGITADEARLLVDSGVDDPSFFANGLIDYPDGISMKKIRFDALRKDALRESRKTLRFTEP